MLVPLLIVPNIFQRTKIEEALADTGKYSSIIAMSRLGAGLRYLEVTTDDNVIIVPTTFGLQALGSFIEEASDLKRDRTLCYMFVVEPNDRTTDLVVDSLILGAHGILCEPFSSDYVSKAISMAITVGCERSYARLKVATHLAVSSAVKDARMNIPFRELAGMSITSYTRPVVDALARVSPSKRLGKDSPFNKLRSLLRRKLQESL